MDRLPTDDSTAPDVFRDIYPARPSFHCAKRINDTPDAWVPTLADQATTMSVVRRLPYVSYRRSYVGFMDDDDVEALITVALRVPAHAPWLARRSLVHRVTRMTCHAPVRTGGAVGAVWDLD